MSTWIINKETKNVVSESEVPTFIHRLCKFYIGFIHAQGLWLRAEVTVNLKEEGNFFSSYFFFSFNFSLFWEEGGFMGAAWGEACAHIRFVDSAKYSYKQIVFTYLPIIKKGTTVKLLADIRNKTNCKTCFKQSYFRDENNTFSFSPIVAEKIKKKKQC